MLFGLIDYAWLNTRPLFGKEVPRDAISLACVLMATIFFVALFWKELKLVSFDPRFATSMGYSTTLVHYLLMAMVAQATVAGFYAVGLVLVVAMLIIPAATGHLLSDRLSGMMAWAVLVAISSAVLGYCGDMRFETGMASMMAMVAGLEFTIALIAAPRHGLASKAWHRLGLALAIVAEDIIAMLYRNAEADPDAADAGLPRRRCLASGGGGWLARLASPLLRWRGELQSTGHGRLRLTAAGGSRIAGACPSPLGSVSRRNFELPLDHLHEPTRRLEHYLGPALVEQLASELHEPGRDPHGKAIPGG